MTKNWASIASIKPDNQINIPIVRKHKTVGKEETNEQKTEDVDDIKAIKKVSHSLKMQIMQARSSKKWTQKELAAKIGVPAKTIQTYENGTAIPDNRILNKLRSVLGTKLKK